jgi:hypothetical protein
MHPRRAYRPKEIDADRAGHLVSGRRSLDESDHDWPEITKQPGPHRTDTPSGRTGRANHRAQGPKRWWPLVVPVVVVAVGASLLFPAGRHQWALSLFRQPTRYTTLSFNEAWALPATAVRGEPIAISFTVSNQEGHTVYYRYSLAQNDGKTSRTLDSSARRIAPGANWLVRTVIKPTCADSPCQIKVTLPGYPQTIDFLLTMKK